MAIIIPGTATSVVVSGVSVLWPLVMQSACRRISQRLFAGTAVAIGILLLWDGKGLDISRCDFVKWIGFLCMKDSRGEICRCCVHAVWHRALNGES